MTETKPTKKKPAKKASTKKATAASESPRVENPTGKPRVEKAPGVKLDANKLATERAKLSDEDRAAIQTICDVTGCGSFVAQHRLAHVSPEDKAKLVSAQKSRNFKPAIAILFG